MRIIRACKEMGIYTVAVYSEADLGILACSAGGSGLSVSAAPCGGKLSRRRAHRRRSFGNLRAQAIHPAMDSFGKCGTRALSKAWNRVYRSFS